MRIEAAWFQALVDGTSPPEVDEREFDGAARIVQIEALQKTVLPRYREDEKSCVTVAFGYTGGRHRSLCVTEEIAMRLREAGFSPTVVHRNLESVQLDAYETRRQGEPKGNEGRGA